LNRTFSTAKEAALARDKEAVKIFEDGVLLNFLPNGTLNPVWNEQAIRGTGTIK